MTRQSVTNEDLRLAGIGDDLRTVFGTLQQLSVPTWLKLDLTMAQFKALVAVQRNQGISVCTLGRELDIGESATSLLVDQLVRRGYVDRSTDPADRRRVRLVVSARGEELVDELRQGGRQIMKEWLAQLGDDDLDTLARGLHALAQAVRSSKAGTAPDAEPIARKGTT
jgi:DNA-binding MarR family transcriptional regulator